MVTMHLIKFCNIVGDDSLFDDLYDVTVRKNPKGDARDVIRKHAKRGLKEGLSMMYQFDMLKKGDMANYSL